jgi:hypothetical protein
MAIYGISLSERSEFILPEDPGNPENPAYKKAVEAGESTEAPTIFYLGNLTMADRVEIGDMTSSPTMRDGAISIHANRTKRSMTTVRRALKGWDNFTGPDGEVFNFKTETFRRADGTNFEGPDDATMSHLTNDIVLQLQERIFELNGIEESFEKKLLTQPQPSEGSLS